jgi:hypothetical protein
LGQELEWIQILHTKLLVILDCSIAHNLDIEPMLIHPRLRGIETTNTNKMKRRDGNK